MLQKKIKIFILQVSSRREYADKILKITQNATFAYLTFQAGSAEENAYNATLADSQNDGFDFFVLYGSSLTGKKFPLQNYHDSDWILEVKDVSNKFGSNFAAMGLIMNHSLGHLMFPAG